jgi:2-(1,2-epoxy-1,2-dihydrophenyl)acetyl-CoA isomerase
MARVERSDDGEVRILTLNRPDARNAMDWPLLRELNAELEAAATKGGPRCLVLTGAGKAFCTGADIQEGALMVAALEKDPEAARADLDAWHEDMLESMRRVFRLPIPTIAMINGAAVGGGLDLSLNCDFRYAAQGAKLRGYGHLGLGPEGGSSWTLPRLVGLDRAKQFCFTGEVWRAEQASAYGMVTEVFPPERLRDATLEFAQRLAAGPTQVFGLIKELLDGTWSRSFDDTLTTEMKTSQRIQETEDHHAMMRAAGIE